MRLMELNAPGIAMLHAWLDHLGSSGVGEPPDELLTAGKYVQVSSIEGEIEPRGFATRYEWALYIETILANEPATVIQARDGLWAWLTVVYFDQVCPLDGNGRRRLRERARYVPTGGNFRKYYRHLLSGPWRLVRAHRDAPSRTLGLLAGPMDTPGEIYEQLVATQSLVTSPTVVQVASHLYFDFATGRRKPGAGGSGPGSPRRLAKVLGQLDLTFDTYGIGCDDLLALLPAEFNRFAQSTGSRTI